MGYQIGDGSQIGNEVPERGMGYQIGDVVPDRPLLPSGTTPALMWALLPSDPAPPGPYPLPGPAPIWQQPYPLSVSCSCVVLPSVPHLASAYIWPHPWPPQSGCPSVCLCPPPNLASIGVPLQCSFLMFISISLYVGWSHLTYSPPHQNNVFHLMWKNSQNSCEATPFPSIKYSPSHHQVFYCCWEIWIKYKNTVVQLIFVLLNSCSILQISSNCKTSSIFKCDWFDLYSLAQKMNVWLSDSSQSPCQGCYWNVEDNDGSIPREIHGYYGKLSLISRKWWISIERSNSCGYWPVNQSIVVELIISSH